MSARSYWDLFKTNSESFVQQGILPRRIRDLRDATKHLKQDEVVLKHTYGSVPTLERLLNVHSGVFAVTLEGNSNSMRIVERENHRRLYGTIYSLFPFTILKALYW